MIENTPDLKAVEVWMKELGFEQKTPGQYYGIVKDGYRVINQEAATFFYQALQNQKNALYEAMLEVIGPMYDYSECDNLPEGDRREIKLTMIGANGSKEKQLVRLAAAFGKDKP
jgi:hypothetical protein